MPTEEYQGSQTPARRSYLGLRHGDHQIHSSPDSYGACSSSVESFHRRVADLVANLLPNSGSSDYVEFLSLSWASKLVDSLLLCLEEFRKLLSSHSCSSGDKIVADFFDRAIKAMDVMNAVREGIDQVQGWRKLAEIIAASLSLPIEKPIGEAQIRRARKAAADLAILMIDDRGSSGSSSGGGFSSRRNSSISLGEGSRHHRRGSSGGGSGSGSGGFGSSSSGHYKSSWCVSRTWSAARQLHGMAAGLIMPRPHEMTGTGGLAGAVLAMGAVLFLASWSLVAMIPCQDRSNALQVHISLPRVGFPWTGPLISLHDRVLEEWKRKERKQSAGLLQEIVEIERCVRQLVDLTDGVDFPMEEKEAEVRVLARELADISTALKSGLDPLERQAREVFQQMVHSRMESLDRRSLN